jgi:hypothetical protein
VETSGFLGWSGTSGAAVMTQASQHVGGAIYDIACFAADIEATSAGEVLVGAGADTAVSSSTTVSPPTLAANVHSGDVHIAGIAELTPGATITAPPDIVQRYAPTYVTGTGNQTFTISSATVVNDFFTVAFGNGAVMSAPAACGSDAWQSLATSGSFIGAFGKIIDSCDISHSYTFTGSSGGVNQGIADFASNSGATISKDTATCGSIASTANPSVPAITTGTDNDTIYSFLFGQASATTPVPPAANIVLWQNNGSAAAGGLYQQGAHGSTGAQAYTTPGSAQTWLYCHVALKTNTAAASPWTHQTSALANESNSVQLDTYSAHGLPANVLEQFHFSASQSTADALIVDVGNLNTTTPVDSSGTLKNEGLANDMTAAIQAPTASDDLALSFMAYSGCSPTLATQGEQIAPAVTLGNKLAAFFMPIDFATTAQVVGSCGGPWASATEGLQSVSAPTQTSAAVRLQYDSETIFSLAPAPLPPTNGGWPF